MNKKIIGGIAVSSVAVIAAALFASIKPVETLITRGTTGYTCASIHFGMKDADNTAVIYDCSTGTTDLSGSYDATAGLVNSITCSTYTASGKTKNTVFVGGAYSGDSPSGYSKYAIKVGAKDNRATVTITFNSNIVGATVYALPYLSSANPAVHEKVTMVVNNQEADLTEATGAPSYSGKKTAKAVTFVPYLFTFSATNTLVLTSKEDKVGGVSATRYYVADIAVRVAA